MHNAPRIASHHLTIFARAFLSALLFLLAVPHLLAQSIQSIPPQQCVWHAGDNPAWAAPAFDDSAWQPYSTWKLDPHTPRLWVRCHTTLAPLRPLWHPALQVHLMGASQVFVNGALAGSSGNLETARYNLGAFYSVPLHPASLSASATIALRISLRDVLTQTDPAQLFLGDQPALDDHRAAVSLHAAVDYLPIAVCFSLIGVVGFMLFGLYVTDRSRLELLLLAIICWLLCDLRLCELCLNAFVPVPSTVFDIAYNGAEFIEILWLLFVFRLARKRIPWLYWFLSIITLWWFANIATIVMPAKAFLAMGGFSNIVSPYLFLAAVVCTTAPLAAFWPWNRIPREMRAIAFFVAAWGLADSLRFLAYALNEFHSIPDAGIAALQNHILIFRAATTLCSVLALLTIFFRDQRRIAQDRALLAGEMASAREIQQYLIPEKLPPTPGLTIRSAYHPSREVGGDFFQILPDPRDGSTLIVVGDVAGKGLKAGMLAALIVGAIRTAFKFTSDPARILGLLNERLQGRGLVTCLAMRVDRDGNAELANAGHLPPYIGGRELAIDGALPLGALPDLAFPVLRLRLQPDQPMLFVSDGVVEAQSPTGELFGFDRTRAISTQAAEAIAQAAQQFGQEDDITVLTLTFAPAEVVHA